MAPRPRDIQATATHLTVVWEDGHESRYSFRALRAYCPCAACKLRTPDELLRETAEDIQPMGAEDVGRYAVRIAWSDGHDTGIYSWEYLRSLCSCAQCATLYPLRSV